MNALASQLISPAETNRLRNRNREKFQGRQLLVTSHNRPFYQVRSIMGCPGGTPAFTHAFRAKRELQCMFLGKGRSLLHPNTAKQSFFSYYNRYLRKLKEKLTQKVRVNTDVSTSDRAHAPWTWTSHNTPQIQLNSIWPPYQ